MLINYIKSALRALLKYRTTTLINILGLTIGLFAVLMISVYVYNEITYDSIHENANRIYRIGAVGKMQGNDLNMAVTSNLMAQPLKDEYPEVEEVTRIYKDGSHMIKYGNSIFNEESGRVLFADSTFFNVFSFKLIKGNPEEVLTDPYSLVLTESSAEKYFGSENPIGKSLLFDKQETNYRITGIVEDPPANSHFRFGFLGSIYGHRAMRYENWLSHNYYTYVLLKEGSNAESFTENINEGIIEKYVAPLLQDVLGLSMDEWYKQGNSFAYITTGLKDIHLKSKMQYEIETTGK